MRRRPLGPIGIRFAVAFVGVALFAVAVFSVAILIADRGNVAQLAATDRDRTAGEVVALARNAYRSGGGWVGADLSPVSTFAAQARVGVVIRDDRGMVLSVGAPGVSTSSSRPVLVERALTVGDARVGTVAVEFPDGGSNPGDSHLSSSLYAAVAWSAALAALGALIAGVLLARGVVRPLKRLSNAVSSLRLGESSPRIGADAGPGELGELGRAFDAMAESLEQEDRLRRELVADVAHELRTPIAVMQGETEALSDGIIPPSPDALGSLHEEAVRLARLVDDLQTLASAQAAGLELNRRAVDLGRVAGDAAESLGSQFRSRGIELVLELPPTPVVGDPHRLHQIAVNLLTNAAKFTPAGGQVKVRSSPVEGGALLEVTDSGPGIPEEEHEVIWRRFYRGTAGRSGTGSGIGLAVVKELVDAHGGTVHVETPASGGTRFVVRFPTAPPVLQGTATTR